MADLRLCGALVAALLVVGCSDQPDDPRPPSEVGEATRSAERVADVEADRDPLTAAVVYVASTDGLMGRSPVGRSELLRRLATPGSAAEQAAALDDATIRLADTLGVRTERLTWVEAPLTAAIVQQSDEEASVDVWTVSILGAHDSGSPQAVWRTVHLDLELSGGQWLVASATADSGPTPASNELASQAGWSDFEEVAGWTPVVQGAEL